MLLIAGVCFRSCHLSHVWGGGADVQQRKKITGICRYSNISHQSTFRDVVCFLHLCVRRCHWGCVWSGRGGFTGALSVSLPSNKIYGRGQQKDNGGDSSWFHWKTPAHTHTHTHSHWAVLSFLRLVPFPRDRQSSRQTGSRLSVCVKFRDGTDELWQPIWAQPWFCIWQTWRGVQSKFHICTAQLILCVSVDLSGKMGLTCTKLCVFSCPPHVFSHGGRWRYILLTVLTRNSSTTQMEFSCRDKRVNLWS